MGKKNITEFLSGIQNRTAAIKYFHFSVSLIFCILFFLQAGSGIDLKSTTFDEMGHLTSGVAYLKTGDFRLNPENGFIPQVFAALPVHLKNYAFPHMEGDFWKNREVWYIGDEFFHYMNNDVQSMLRDGRRMIIFIGMALGLLIYYTSIQIFGLTGGLVSLTLYLFSPDMLAHSALITSDLTVTFMFLITLISFWRLFHKISFLTLTVSSLSLSLLFLSKMSAVLILPTALILMVIRILSDKPIVIAFKEERVIHSAIKKVFSFLAIILINGAVVFFGIWAANNFRYIGSYGVAPDYPWAQTLAFTGVLKRILSFFRDYQLLPESYLFGFSYILSEASARPAFLNGEFRTTGWWYFFPYSFLIKTPISTLLILFCSFAAIIKVKNPFKIFGSYKSDIKLNSLLIPLSIFFCLYLFFAIKGNLNLGVRHIIPVYPVLFIFGGGISLLIRRDAKSRDKKARWLLLIPIFVLIIESLSVRPHYLAFFNAFAGGPKEGYKHLVDSSLDWGQDLPSLKMWIDKERRSGNKEPLFLSFFGIADPAYYSIKSIRLPGCFNWDTSYKSKLTGGIYAISATMLQNIYNPLSDIQGPYWYPAWEKAMVEIYQKLGQEKENEKREDLLWKYNMYRFAKLTSYLRKNSPVDQAGYSILIYKVSQKDITDLFGNQGNLENNI